MICVLVVTDSRGAPSELAAAIPSVEVLLAGGAEEAVEKLGRNRRIDAVLLLTGTETEAVVSAIREDNPAPPPLFRPAGETPAAEGVLVVEGDSPARLLEAIASALSG